MTLHCRCGSVIYTPRFAYFENFPAAELLMRLKVRVTPTYFTRLSLFAALAKRLESGRCRDAATQILQPPSDNDKT
jgi:hypothetical protein